MAAVVFVSADLMFGSRLVGAAQALGVSLQSVPVAASLPGKLSADCRLVIVDLVMDGLDLQSVIAAVRSAAPAAKVVSYGAHVDEAALSRAEDAGRDLVLSRGQFHQQYAELLRKAVA